MKKLQKNKQVIKSMIFLIFVLILFICSVSVQAGMAYLTWNQNTESDLAGYKLYYGTSPRSAACANQSHGYTKMINLNKVTSYNITNLPDGNIYYFSITAYDTSGNEGCFSSEVSKSMSVAPPINLSVTNASITSMKIAQGIIVIDGQISESAWSNADSITFSNLARSNNIVKVYTLYDNSNLYFAYDVTDSNLETYDGNLWNEDGAEIYLDTLNDKTTSTNSNDYHILANINDLKSPTSLNVKTIKSANKYTMEIAIPWSSINTQPILGKKIGILIGNNDRDNGIAKQFDWLGIIDIPPGSYSRPNLWGNLTLISRADSDKDACIEASELLTFINRWKSLNTDVSIKELIEVIGLWKRGC